MPEGVEGSLQLPAFLLKSRMNGSMYSEDTLKKPRLPRLQSCTEVRIAGSIAARRIHAPSAIAGVIL